MELGSPLTTASATNNPIHIPFFLLPSYCTPTRRSVRTSNVSFPLKKPRKLLVRASKDDFQLDENEQMALEFGRLMGEDPNLTVAKIMAKRSNPDVSYLEVEKSFKKRKGKPVVIEELPFDVERKSTSSWKELNLVRPVPKKGFTFEADSKPIKSNVKNGSQLVRNPVVDDGRGPLPNVILRKPTALNKDDIGPQTSSQSRTKPNPFLDFGNSQAEKLKVDSMQGSLPNVDLRKPTMLNEDDVGPEKSSQLIIKPNSLLEEGNTQPVRTGVDNMVASFPNIVLRKPSAFNEDDIGPEYSSQLRMEQNLSLAMGNKEIEDRFSYITLKKPDQMSGNFNIDKKQESNAEDDSQKKASIATEAANMIRLLSQPKGTGSAGKVNTGKSNYAESVDYGNVSLPRDFGLKDISSTGLQPLEPSVIGSSEKISASEMYLVDSNMKGFVDAARQGKPRRLDQGITATSNLRKREVAMSNFESYGNVCELENFLATSTIKEEDFDWKRVEELAKTGQRENVEVISYSTRGFVVSFGSLIGFLPYRDVAPRWKFLAFESWLRRNGIEPSKYKHNLGVIGKYGIANETSLDSSLGPEIGKNVDVDISPDMAVEDLLRIYNHEKLKHLSIFVGQKMPVHVVLADRNTRRLIFSSKPKEAEELIEKRRNLMAKLSIGDVVKCRITKFKYTGLFVEVEGVPALIHETEVSWDATLDPGSYFKIGQIIEAKVHQLDFSMDRIHLSLKGMAYQSSEARDAVIGEHDSLDGRSEAAQANTEWTEVESLIKELQQFEGIQSVSKGRFSLSPGLAPTFQVYMASVIENEYKLLARSENKVQELIIQATLGKEEVKSAILTCTKRIE